MAKYQDCLKNCNSDFRNGRSKDKLQKCGAKCRIEAEKALASCRDEALDSGRDVSEDEGPTLEECIEKCREKDPNAMGEITKYGRCLCGCKSGWGYPVGNPEKCVDCNEYCSKRSKDDSNITGVKETKDLCLCRCKNKNQLFNPSSGRCEKVCPDHSTLVGTKCVCDEGYTKVSEKACCPNDVFCYLGQSCKDCVDNCICPTGSVCRPGSELADSRGCVVEQCNKNGKCEKGEDCLTCENDCKCTGELKCHPDDPLSDKRGCIKVVCNYDGTCDAGENCRYCPDCGCRSDETCEICDKSASVEPRWMCIGYIGEYDAGTIKSLSYGYVWIRRSMTTGPVWIKAQPGMTLRVDDEVRLRRMDNEHTHVDIEWSNGARSIAFFRRDSGDTEGRFYMGKIRSETRDPSTGEPAFPPDNPTVIEKYGEDAYDVAVFICTSCLKIPNPITLPLGIVLSNEKLGQEPMTFINVKSEVYLEPKGNGEYTLYVFEGSAEVTRYDEDASVVSREIISAGESSVIDVRGNPAPAEPFDPDSIDRFWDVNPLSLRKQGMVTSGLTFQSRSKPSGSSVQIPLTLKGIEEKIGNIDITLSYDPSVLEATEVIKGGLTANSIFDYNILNQGTIKISLADTEGFSDDGSIAYVKFNVIGSEGSSSPLQIVAIAANRAEDDEALEIPTIDGVFRIISMEEGRGDSDGDGEYTALDALCALQMAVEKIPEDLVMDMNGDGSVTSLDAREILRIAVGLESK